MFTIEFERYPRRIRWMRGTVVKQMSAKNILSLPWKEELEIIAKKWFEDYFETSPIVISSLHSISSRESEYRLISFLRSMKIYDIRIIHLRNHHYHPSIIKLKISFKRQKQKIYESIKLIMYVA